jgi:hypothetical protein
MGGFVAYYFYDIAWVGLVAMYVQPPSSVVIHSCPSEQNRLLGVLMLAYELPWVTHFFSEKARYTFFSQNGMCECSELNST